MSRAARPPSPQRQVADQLYAAAVAQAAAQGRRFKPSTVTAMKELSALAAEEVVAPGRFGERSKAEAELDLEARIAHATTAVRTLVDAMAEHAREVPGYQPDRLGERTLAHAYYVSSICPCWPFC